MPLFTTWMWKFTHEWEALGVREPGAALTHGIAMAASVVALVGMLVRAVSVGTSWHIVGAAVFGTALIVTYAISMSYHIVSYASVRAKGVMQRLDRSLIYVLIAGTYTPICITVLRGPWGWSLFGAVWTLSIIGFLINMTGVALPKWLPPLLYIALGWMAIIAIVPLYRVFGWAGLGWLVGGGLAYTIGVIFFAIDRLVPRTKWWGMHELFHIFVVLGSALHFVLIWQYVLV